MNTRGIRLTIEGEEYKINPQHAVETWQRCANELSAARKKLAAAEARIAEETELLIKQERRISELQLSLDASRAYVSELTAAKEPDPPKPDDLKPCPCCGGDPSAALGFADRNFHKTGCLLRHWTKPEAWTRLEREAWNRRPPRELGQTAIGRKVLAYYVDQVKAIGGGTSDEAAWAHGRNGSISCGDIRALAAAADALARGEDVP